MLFLKGAVSFREVWSVFSKRSRNVIKRCKWSQTENAVHASFESIKLERDVFIVFLLIHFKSYKWFLLQQTKCFKESDFCTKQYNHCSWYKWTMLREITVYESLKISQRSSTSTVWRMKDELYCTARNGRWCVWRTKDFTFVMSIFLTPAIFTETIFLFILLKYTNRNGVGQKSTVKRLDSLLTNRHSFLFLK